MRKFLTVLKAFEHWKSGELAEYLEVGDLVDDEMVNYFLTAMPPAFHSDRIIQMGDPHYIGDNDPLYMTLILTNRGWMFHGDCFQFEEKAVVGSAGTVA